MVPKNPSTDDLFEDHEHNHFDEFEEEGDPLVDALDAEILMHRDAHFGGQFTFMIDYYRKGGKGINPEFELPYIEEMARIEQQSGQNLAGVLLSGSDAELVGRAREAYRKLRDAAQGKKRSHAQLLANLILSEDEEMVEEIDALVEEGPAIVPALLQLVQSEEYYEPLFPGYGMAPILAMHCLGRLKDERAIPVLFEEIGRGDFFNEDTICHALQEIGEPAKAFLLKILHSRPLNEDNERAALALGYFSQDPSVGLACLEQLQNEQVLKREPLATYLVLACSGLRTKVDRDRLLTLAQQKELSASLKRDIQTIAHEWAK